MNLERGTRFAELPPSSVQVFAQKVVELIHKPDVSGIDWYHTYQSDTEFAQVVNSMDENTLGIFLVAKALEIPADDARGKNIHLQASLGFNRLLTIKLFSRARAEFESTQSFHPSASWERILEKGMEFQATGMTKGEIQTMRELRSVWGGATPPRDEKQKTANTSLRGFCEIFQKKTNDSHPKDVQFSQVLDAWRMGAREDLLDELMKGESHWFNMAFGYGFLFTTAINYYSFYDISDRIKNSQLPNLETSGRLLTWLQAHRDEIFDKEKRIFFLSGLLTQVEERARNLEKTPGAIDLQLTLSEGYNSSDIEYIIDCVCDHRDSFRITPNDEIFLFAQDISWQTISEARVDYLLIDIANGLTALLWKKRLKNQRPNTTADVLSAMEELAAQYDG